MPSRRTMSNDPGVKNNEGEKKNGEKKPFNPHIWQVADLKDAYNRGTQRLAVDPEDPEGLFEIALSMQVGR